MTSSRWSSRTAYSHVYYHSQSSRYHSQTVAAGALAPAERPLSVKDLPRANNTPRIVIRSTRHSLGTPHIYKHMVKMYSAGVDGHQMSGIMLSHTAASSEEGIQSQLPTSPLARWSRRRHRSLRGGRRKCSCTVLVQCACCCFMAALLVDPSERRRSSRRRDPVNVR